MSGEERIRHQGRLAEARQKAEALKIRIDGLKESIRLGCDEFAPIEDLKGQHIVQLALDLAQAHIEYVETTATIRALERALGR